MNITSLFHSVREYWTPVLTDSKFRETGVVTPEEFAAAGDYLVFKCPTWHWESGDAAKIKDYLPKEKQYLVTRNVPCLMRVNQFEYSGRGRDVHIDGDGGEGWVATHSKGMCFSRRQIAF